MLRQEAHLKHKDAEKLTTKERKKMKQVLCPEPTVRLVRWEGARDRDGGYAHTYSSRGRTEVSDGKRTPGEAGGVPPTSGTGHA